MSCLLLKKHFHIRDGVKVHQKPSQAMTRARELIPREANSSHVLFRRWVSMQPKTELKVALWVTFASFEI